MREAENISDFPILSLVLPFEYSSAALHWDQQTNKKKIIEGMTILANQGWGIPIVLFPRCPIQWEIVIKIY